MEMDLIKFNDLIEVINKDLSLYRDDEKGMMFYLNTVQLLTRVEPLELDKSQYEIALFEKKIDKLDYKEETIERPTPKNRITKRDEDKYTLVMEKVKVKKVYNVANALNVKKSFVDKEEAMKYAETINNKIKEHLI
jgi:hypothetical protein